MKPTTEQWEKAYDELADYTSKIAHPSRSNDKRLYYRTLATIRALDPRDHVKEVNTCPECGKKVSDAEANG